MAARTSDPPGPLFEAPTSRVLAAAPPAIARLLRRFIVFVTFGGYAAEPAGHI